MTNLTRKNQKVFASGASNNGQFGSLQAETKVLSNDVETLQALAAYESGWNSAVVSGEQLPSLEEFQALNYINTYQIGYLLQKGFPEWNTDTTYYIGDLAREVEGTKIYKSITNSNSGNALTDVVEWQLLGDLADLINSAQATTSSLGSSYLPNRITIANNSTDSDHDIDFSGGTFNFDDGSGQAVASALTKQTDTTWAAGDNQGGMEAPLTLTGTYTTSGTTVTGSGSAFTTEFSVGDALGSSAEAASRRITAIASNTSMTLSQAFSSDVTTPESVKRGGWVGPDITYHMFAIYNPTTGLSDYLFSTSLTNPNLPSGYTKKTKIASLITDGAANIRTGKYYFKPDGSYRFQYNVIIADVSINTIPTGSRTLYTLSVPPNCTAITTIGLGDTTPNAGTKIIYITNPDLDDNAALFSLVLSQGGTADEDYTTYFEIETNLNSQVGIRGNSSTPDLDIHTRGWIDYNL